MRSGPSASSATCAARKAKLGLSLAGFAMASGLGLRATLARQAAAEAILAASRAGVALFDAAEHDEALIRGVGEGRFLLTMHGDGLGPDQLEGRVALARGRMQSLRPLTLLLEGASLLAANGDALWARASGLLERGVIVALGVRAEPGSDALGLARRFKPDLMHVAAGLLDQRLITSGALGEIAALDIEVQVRTTLLRGLLFLPREGLPSSMAEAAPMVSRVRRAIAEAGADPLQAALAFALDRPEASGVIVEAGSAGEVRAILAAAAAPSPQLDWPSLALDHPAALNAEAGLRPVAA